MTSGNRLETLSSLAIKSSGTETQPILKSATDEKNYKFITLPNEIRTLLISDPSTEASAASLSVNVGSFSDPPDLPGLAHFLEHMLFMGTEKFPVESEYSEFLASHGGYSNAYTGAEVTNYHFKVESNHFFDALDRFSQFFIAPLFDPSSTKREARAVDNEFSGNIQSDLWRQYLISCDLCSKEHPYSKFNIGNLETLEKIPEEKGINVRERLLKFFDEHYSSNLMTLVVLGREDLDTLEKNVLELFSAVPNHNRDKFYVHPSKLTHFSKDAGNLCVEVPINPVRDTHQLSLSFMLPPVTYNSNLVDAAKYLGALIGDEGVGSVFSALKGKNLVNSLSAGLGDNNYDFSTFDIHVICTETGISKVDEIIEAIFGYVNMLKGSNFGDYEYFFEEQKLLSLIRFWFKDPQDPIGYVTGLSAKMHKDFPINQILTANYVPFGVEKEPPANVTKLLDMFTPENLLLCTSTKNHEKNNPEILSKVEPWFKTKYGVVSLKDEQITTWKNTESWKDLGFGITPKNKFVPNRFDILPFKRTNFTPIEGEYPKLLKRATESKFVQRLVNYKLQDFKNKREIVAAPNLSDGDVTEPFSGKDDVFRKPVALVVPGSKGLLWFKQDTVYEKPQTRCRVFLKNPIVNESLESSYLTSIFTSLVNDALNEVMYSASESGFKSSISHENNGFIFTFTGFSDREPFLNFLNLVANNFVDLLSKYSTEFSDEDVAKFNRYKEKKVQDVDNLKKAKSYQQAWQIYNEFVLEKFDGIAKKDQVVNALSVEALQSFLKRMLEQQFGLEMFVSGNAVEEDAKAYLASMETIFKTDEAPAFQNMRSVKIPENTQNFAVRFNHTADNPTSAIFMNFQFGEYSRSKYALLRILSSIMKERFFNQLRTIEQLGYLVHSMIQSERGVLNLCFLIESNKASPFFLNDRIENYVAKFKAELDSLKDDDFEALVAAEVIGLLTKPKSLKAEESSFFGEIKSNLYDFSEKLDLAKEISSIQKADVEQLLEEYFYEGAPKRSKFTAGSLSALHMENEDIKENVKEFRAGLSLTQTEIKSVLAQSKFVENRGTLVVLDNVDSFKESTGFSLSFAEVLEGVDPKL
eukprot:augustus_masked-scaffold_6-processed-gene-11.1-mRNA-1 protein AED:0.03 eAED:0.06 QI:0/-1/0/1/-1/1/1/0/1091